MSERHWRDARPRGFTLIEIMIMVVVLIILVGILLPVVRKARVQAKFARWLTFNASCSRDPACVINYNFQNGYGTDSLTNSAQGHDFGKSTAQQYDGVVHNADWSVQGRWTRNKRALSSTASTPGSTSPARRPSISPRPTTSPSSPGCASTSSTSGTPFSPRPTGSPAASTTSISTG